MALVTRNWTNRKLLRKRNKYNEIMRVKVKHDLAEKLKDNYVDMLRALSTVLDTDPNDQTYELQMHTIKKADYPEPEFCTPLSLLELDELWEA